MSTFLDLNMIDRFLFLYPISNRTKAALLLMATDECLSFSVSIGMAPLAIASKASTRRQLESVSRISSWISSSSVFNLTTRKGIKPACRTSTAPTGGDKEGTWVRCECSYYFYPDSELLNRSKIYMSAHVLAQMWDWEIKTTTTLLCSQMPS